MAEQEPYGDSPSPDTWWHRGGRLLRWLLGAATLVGGLTWILLNMHTATLLLDVTIGVVLVAGGLVLLMPHRIALPRAVTAVVVTLAALIGTGAGLAAADRQVCCRFAYVEDRGWPVEWVQRGAAADDPDAARRLAESADWTVDVFSLAADLVLWAYAGMLIVVAAVLVRRRRDRPIRS
jgi:hypothetical protein